MLEAGTYAAQLIQTRGPSGAMLWAQFGFSSKNRTPQVILTFKIVGGKEDGITVQWNGFFTDTAGGRDGKTPAERAMDSLATVGFTGNDPDTFNDQTPHGRVQIVTEVEEYNGSRRAKVKFINSGTFTMGGDDFMSTADLKSLGARLKAAKAKRNAPSSFNPNGPDEDHGDGWPPHSQPTGQDDDIPF